MLPRLLGLTAAALLAGAATNAEPSGTLHQPHDVGYGQASSVDPFSKGKVFQVTEKIYSRLIRLGLDGKPAPDLAMAWSANADATEWTLNLRPDVKFHDGHAFTAADVVYTLNRAADPKLDTPVRSAVKPIKAVEAIDPATVKITLNAPFADFPLILTDYRLVIIPDGSGDTIAASGTGTGPFRLDKFDAQGTTVLSANPGYYEGAPRLARIEVVGIPDAQARFQALLGGQVDVLQGLSRQEIALIGKSAKHQLQLVPTANWRGIVFRADVKPYDDVRVRRALRLAVDRTAMRDLVVGPEGGVTGCDTPVGPADQYRWDGACKQDIAGAKALLAEAGYPNGLDVEIHVATIEPIWPTIAQVYQQLVTPAGIRVKITQVPNDGYWSNIWMKKDAVMTRWNDRHADAALNEIFTPASSWDESHFSDPTFDQMLAAARREPDFAKRKALYQDAQHYLYDNGSTFVAFHVRVGVGLTARVKDLDAVENFSIRWNKVHVD
jgi:peptide/nickel transport system substrate-binding protein